ncbi:cupin domain-containing protein [Pseudoruegeria sp. HB172150]|uniref:cupin domain-containing protein n=1 Tax=Pseudoruegeria sp. HB172150 TaxID=2721164 RepID=UPI0015578717|nr:cupin domain-containing protein [Pseudoruegeria sp. HB172150]
MPAIPEGDMHVELNGDGPCGPSRCIRISDPDRLTQFGAFVEILPPGSSSSIKHWHSAEDEMIYVLEGEITLIEGDEETVLHPGDAATFRANEPVGHCLINRSDAPTRCLVVGTRASYDRITYPDRDRVCLRDRSLPGDLWFDTSLKPADSAYSD